MISRREMPDSETLARFCGYGPQYATEDPSHYQAPMYVYGGTNRTFAYSAEARLRQVS
jgi:hypothetical protein